MQNTLGGADIYVIFLIRILPGSWIYVDVITLSGTLLESNAGVVFPVLHCFKYSSILISCIVHDHQNLTIITDYHG